MRRVERVVARSAGAAEIFSENRKDLRRRDETRCTDHLKTTGYSSSRPPPPASRLGGLYGFRNAQTVERWAEYHRQETLLRGDSTKSQLTVGCQALPPSCG